MRTGVHEIAECSNLITVVVILFYFFAACGGPSFLLPELSALGCTQNLVWCAKLCSIKIGGSDEETFA